MTMLACIGLGANLGDAAATVRTALQALDALPHTRLLRASRLYRTPAWGKTDQPAFVNAAAILETTLDARDLLDRDVHHGFVPRRYLFGRCHGA